MFTGIVEELGHVKEMRRGARSSSIAVKAHEVLEGTRIGDSIAVNGVCLTVAKLDASSFSADVMNETLARSSLGSLRAGHPVNLERAMQLGGRFGGHIVSGHIDGVGTISSVREDGNAVWYAIAAPPCILRYVIEKGSISIDGISLTVAGVGDEDFSVSVIPHTRAQTNLGARRAGDAVNLECDCIGKYVEKMLGGTPLEAGEAAQSGAYAPNCPPASSASSPGGITEAFLFENGF